MCGIVGVTGVSEPALVGRMLSIVANRGPDASKTFTEPGVHFGFARLSINDLSDTGNQPMRSESERFVSMMNGEIYNAPQLRHELESYGYRFRGTSDAEVIPHGFCKWGLQLFQRLRGMFAIAVYDRTTRQLVLARDQFGIKPLYYASTRDGVSFASSARAVSLHPAVGQAINSRAVAEFLRFRYVSSGTPLYSAVHSVLPGQMVICSGKSIEYRKYWSRQHFSETASESITELTERFSVLLRTSVKRQLVSDVPLGVLLSGGIDSGAVLRAAIAAGASDLTAYTYDMAGKASEAADAARLSSIHGVRHRVISGVDDDFGDTYVRAIQCMDLPVGDAIVAPTYQLLKTVGQERKVVLTGEGADELLAGYAHIAPLRLLGRLPSNALARGILATAVRMTPWRVLNSFFPYEASLGKSGKTKVVDIVASSNHPWLALEHATSIFSQLELTSVINASQQDKHGLLGDLSLESLIDWGFDSWLPNQILNKMDQLSMAHGVEARVPFVDVELYELVATLPTRLLLSSRGNKRVLRDALKGWGYDSAEKPKRAFFKPVTNEHRGELRSLAKDWLSPSSTSKHGIITDELVSRSVARLEKGDFLAAKQVATMAALHIWLEQDFQR